MDRNVKMYNAAKLLVLAARELRGFEDVEDIRDGLIETSKTLLDKVEIDEEENAEVEKYEHILKGELKDVRTDVD